MYTIYSPALYGAPLIQGHRAQLLGVLGVMARMLRVRFRLLTEVVSYQDSPKQPSLTTAGELVLSSRHPAQCRRTSSLTSLLWQMEKSFSPT